MRINDHKLAGLDRSRQEQLKLLAKVLHHLRSSAAFECADEHDGSAEYWADFFQKVSEYFRGPGTVDKWGKWWQSHRFPSTSRLLIIVVRQLYITDATTQSNGIAVPSDALLCPVVNFSVPTDRPSENAKWTPALESDIIDGEPLHDEAVAMAGRKDLEEVKRVIRQAEEAKPSCNINLLQDRLVTGNHNGQVRVVSAASGDTVKSKPAKPVESERIMDVDTNDAAENKPAENQGIVDPLIESAAIRGVSVGSESIVRAATSLSEISGAGMSTNEDRGMNNGVALGNLAEANLADRHIANTEADGTNAACDAMKPSRVMVGIPLEKPTDSNARLHKLDVVGSAKTLTMDDIVIQSGPVGLSSAKDGVQSGNSQSPAQSSIVEGTRSESQPSATATQQSNVINPSAERKRKRGSIELRTIGETVNGESLQHKSPSSSAQDKGSRQLEPARHGLAKSEPASMEPAGSDEPEKLRTARRTRMPFDEADGMTGRLATKQLTPSSGETSLIPPKQDSMYVGGLEAGDCPGLDLRLSGRVGLLKVFCRPRDGQRGPYVVVVFERQLGLVAAAIGMVGAFLYFAYRWLL